MTYTNRKRLLSMLLCAVFSCVLALGSDSAIIAVAEGGDLLSDFFGGTATQEPQKATPAPENQDPFASLAESDDASADDPFAAFFGVSETEESADVVDEQPTATPDATSRFTKYDAAPPRLQEKFMAGEFYYANPDFVGYVTAGVDVAEPVPFCRDNAYYLTHNFMGEEDKAGAAFMDGRNMLWPRSQHIVIHGHNQKDGSIFGTLDEMRKLKNLKKYPTVQFDTIYEDGTYVIYAAFNASMNKDDRDYFDLEKYDFEKEEDFNAFIDEILKRSMYDIPVDVSFEDELLTLVTCSYYQDNGRFLLFTRKLRADETIESVTKLMKDAKQLSSH
ncbi:MAG: class B sortase [Clostridiales bacterium]|nr:class B sortase [Clostridiales bacterium]